MTEIKYEFELVADGKGTATRITDFTAALGAPLPNYTQVMGRDMNIFGNPVSGGIIYSGYVNVRSSEEFAEDVATIAKNTGHKVAKLDIKTDW